MAEENHEGHQRSVCVRKRHQFECGERCHGERGEGIEGEEGAGLEDEAEGVGGAEPELGARPAEGTEWGINGGACGRSNHSLPAVAVALPLPFCRCVVVWLSLIVVGG